VEAEGCEAVDNCLVKLDEGEACDILPVPERALVEVLPSGTEYKLTKLRNSVYSFFDGGYFAMFIRSRGGKRMTIVDVPETSMAGGPDSLFAKAVKEAMSGSKPSIFDIIYSHGHYDHIGGANIIKSEYPNAKINIWGTGETRKFIQASTSKRAPEPNKIIGSSGKTLKLKNDLTLQMDVVGGHMREDLMIHIPRANGQSAIAMHVDVVFPRWSPWPNLAVSMDVRAYIESVEDILNYDFDIFVPGHLRLGDKTDVEDFGHFLQDLLDAGKVGVESSPFSEFMEAGYGKIFDPSNPEYGNVWYAFVNTVRKVQVDKCYRTMIEKWGCKIGGLDITLRSHCFLAVTYALLDE